jgi:hypothetical protein
MGRKYAGILGMLALSTVMARGVLKSASMASTMTWGLGMMVIFALAGWLLGSLAEQKVTAALKGRFADEMDKLTKSSE